MALPWTNDARARLSRFRRPLGERRAAAAASGDLTMKSLKHLWAVGYDDMERAHHVRDEIVRLGWVQNSLILEDVAVVARKLDGSFTLDRERFPAAANVVGS